MKIKKNIAVSETGFVFDPVTGDSFSLNDTGKEIFELLKSNKTPSEITKHITGGYNIDEPTFERYFYDFVEILKFYHLLEDVEE